jgi:ligand-binding SRPBCC domain-containing protein
MKRIRILARYLGVVAVHKWAIVVAGLRVNRALRPASLRVSLRRLVLHDLSKLSRAELWPYAAHFARADRTTDPAFEAAWRHHYEHNDHHPEHFIIDGVAREMPDEAVCEMVADWLAAARAYQGAWPCCGGHWRWLEDSWDRLQLHPTNRALAGAIVLALGYAEVVPSYDWSAPDAPPRTRAQIAALHDVASGQLE